MPGIAIAVVIAIIAVVASSGDDNKTAKTPSQAASGPGEIFLEPIAENGPDPFTASAAAPAPPVTVPASTPVTLAPATSGGPPQTAPVFQSGGGGSSSGGPVAVRPRSGGTPGLYGGTGNQKACDKQQMIAFLDQNPAKKAAWAQAAGISTSEVGSYIDSLTPVVLRSDTRVTNNGFKKGRPTPRQAVLQAGTAVLVDNRGVPRARCACGNPLSEPEAVPTTPTYTGPPWPGFTPTNVTVINQSTTVINVITVINITNGTPYGQPTGPGYPPPVALPGLTPTTTAVTTPSTTSPATGGFTLVDAQAVINDKSVCSADARAGTGRWSNGTDTADYQWTVPPTISASGTTIEWGGTSRGNMSVDISAGGEGITFNPNDLRANGATGQNTTKRSVITAAATASEVKLIYDASFSCIRATYTYRR